MDLYQIIIKHNRTWTVRELIFFLISIIIIVIYVCNLLSRKRIVLSQAVAGLLLFLFLGVVFGSTVFTRIPGERQYKLELFWSYKKWILEGSVAFGLEILNNIVLFFPFGFILTDALRRCPFWAVLLSSLAVSGCIEMSQLVFRLGLFEFDDIFNNVLGAVAGWCVFHILRSFKRRRRPESSSVYSG